MHGNTGRRNPHGEVAYSSLSRPEQLAYMREKNRKYYLKRVGKLKRCPPSENTPERIAERNRNKSNLRCTRAKKARFFDELSIFVYSEAHDLRKRRNKETDIDWHVDHVVPLINKDVCGLHIWSNFAVIPKVDNLRKGNYHSVHD